MKKKEKTKTKITDLKLEVSTEVSLITLFSKALNKYNAKDIIDALCFVCSFEGASYAYSMLGMLATEKDVDTVKAMWVLRYIIDNWDNDKFIKKTAQHFNTIMKRK